ncbi:MAG: FecR domain-containing protein [Opitutae bacterium]|nr:FecR domain-containing protein [Opitutae bacterium]
MTIPSFRLFVGAAMFAALCLVASAQIQPGAIKAARVQNDVQKVLADGKSTPIKDGDLLTENDTLVTGANSSVVLVFMNGSTVQVGANTKLAVEEFKMDPFAEDIAVGKLDKEPSTSRTTLNVTYGEIVGNVKKLSKGSSYNVHTPVGAAGIRGTTFRIALTPIPGTTSFALTLSTAEGVVLFTGTTPAGTAPATPVEVSAGTEVGATIDVTPTATGATAQVSATTTISPEATAVINAVAAAIQQAQQTTVFTTVEQQAAKAAADKAAADKAEADKAAADKAAADKAAADKAAADKAAADKAAADKAAADKASADKAAADKAAADKNKNPVEDTTTPQPAAPPDTRSTASPGSG